MSEQLWWYTARAGGIVSWALLAASVLWGLGISSKITHGKPRPNWMLDMHRFLGGLAMIFVGVHVIGLVLDSYVHFGPAEILVPMASGWNPGAVAWGVVAMYLLAAVELTSLARRKMPKRVWRLTHGLAFPTFAFSTVHLLTAGTDSGNPVLRVAMWASTIAVGLLTLLRGLQVRHHRRRPRRRPVPTSGGRPARTGRPTGPQPAMMPATVPAVARSTGLVGEPLLVPAADR